MNPEINPLINITDSPRVGRATIAVYDSPPLMESVTASPNLLAQLISVNRKLDILIEQTRPRSLWERIKILCGIHPRPTSP